MTKKRKICMNCKHHGRVYRGFFDCGAKKESIDYAPGVGKGCKLFELDTYYDWYECDDGISIYALIDPATMKPDEKWMEARGRQ